MKITLDKYQKIDLVYDETSKLLKELSLLVQNFYRKDFVSKKLRQQFLSEWAAVEILENGETPLFGRSSGKWSLLYKGRTFCLEASPSPVVYYGVVYSLSKS